MNNLQVTFEYDTGICRSDVTEDEASGISPIVNTLELDIMCVHFLYRTIEIKVPKHIVIQSSWVLLNFRVLPYGYFMAYYAL